MSQSGIRAALVHVPANRLRFRSLRGPVQTRNGRMSPNTPSSVFTLRLCLVFTSADSRSKGAAACDSLGDAQSSAQPSADHLLKACPAKSTRSDLERLALPGPKRCSSQTLKAVLQECPLRPAFLKHSGRYAQARIKCHSSEPQPLVSPPSRLFHSGTLLPLTFPISQHSWAVPHQSKGQFMGLMRQRAQTGLGGRMFGRYLAPLKQTSHQNMIREGRRILARCIQAMLMSAKYHCFTRFHMFER